MSSTPSKKYRLLKDIQYPGEIAKAGTLSEREGEYFVFPYEGRLKAEHGWLGCGAMYLEEFIKDNPDWFSEESPVDSLGKYKVKRITENGRDGNDVYGWEATYMIRLFPAIEEDMYPVLQSIIENGLNGTSTLYDNHQEALEQMSKMYTQEQLDKAIVDAKVEGFKAAKTYMVGTYVSQYSTIEDYLSSLSTLPSVSSEKIVEVKEDKGKDWEILEMRHLNGSRVRAILETGNDWSIWLKSPNYQISKVRRNSDGEIFTVGDEITFNNEAHAMKITCFNYLNGCMLVGFGTDKTQTPSFLDNAKKVSPSLPKVEDEREEVIKGCNVCGTALVLIRGRHPGCDKREVCPTCATEKLEQINQMSDPDYGKTSQCKQ